MSVPERIGEWAIEAPLGAGGFATVWLAYSESLDGRAAIKVLADNWAQNPDVRNRFLAEARILFGADHERIVRVYQYGVLPDGRPWFAMNLADRGSLRQRMTERRAQGQVRFPPRVAVAYASEVAECLTVVHELGYIHRDVNPGNVLIRTLALHQRKPSSPFLAADEQILLADLGLAKEQARSSGFTSVVGTPAYMAPEQVRADDGIDGRVDVYALMVLTHELVFGHLPTAEPLGDETRCPVLRAAIARGLEADPDHRFSTPREAAAALTAALDRDLGPSPPDGDPLPPDSRPARGAAGRRTGRRRRLAGGLAAVGGLVAAVVIVPRVTARDPSSRRPSATTTSWPSGLARGENFSQKGGWLVLKEDKRDYGYVDGQYRMEVKGQSRTYAVGAPFAPPGANVRVKVEATKVTDVDARFGVTCRVGSGLNNQASKYIGGIGTDGSWLLNRIDAGVRSVENRLAAPADPSEYSQAVRPSGPNTIALECTGSEAPGSPVVLRLSLNGQTVKEHTDPQGLGAGTVGVAVVSGARVPVDVRFDNFEVTPF